jgi:hypothetical protein
VSHKPSKPIDWPAVELEYRAGIRSLKSIGKEFGVSDAGILKRAKRDEWTRDLATRIKARAADKIARLAVSPEVAKQKTASEAQVVESHSDLQRDATAEHRHVTSGLVKAAASMIEEMTGINDPEIREGLRLFAVKRSDELDSNETRAMMKALDAVLSLPGRVLAFQKIAQGAGVAIDKDRLVLGMDKGEDHHMSYIEFLESLAPPEEARREREQRERENPMPWKQLPNAAPHNAH